MKISWLEEAIWDLKALREYISQENINAAKNLVLKILHSINLLENQPGLGRRGRVLNTRELVIPGTPYIVPYRVKAGSIEILRIFHSAMKWPEEL